MRPPRCTAAVAGSTASGASSGSACCWRATPRLPRATAAGWSRLCLLVIEESIARGPGAKTPGCEGNRVTAAHGLHRLDPAAPAWGRRKAAVVPEMLGYCALGEDRHPDPYLLARAVDGLPPVVF